MACRIILSPITNKEETSILWNEIRSIVPTDEQADAAYGNTTTEEFVEVFGNWVEEPESIDKNKVNSIGEPILTEEVKSFIGLNSSITKEAINYYDEPEFKKRNPDFNPEAYVNTVNKFGETKQEFPELTPTLNEVKPGVEEIFNNNPELANQVYEALGFNKNLVKAKVISKTTAKEILNSFEGGMRENFKNVINKLLEIPAFAERTLNYTERPIGNAMGFYDSLNDFIGIDVLSKGETNAAQARVIVEEIIHSLTSRPFKISKGSMSGTLSKAEKEFVNNISNLRKEVLKQRPQNANDYYGLSSDEEFIARSFVDETFQAYLSRIEVERTNVFSKIIEFVKQLLGSYVTVKDNSALQEVLGLTEDFISKQQPATQQKATAQQLYSQYLQQNPNSSVEQFKSWVEEFNKNNQKLNSNIQIFSDNKQGDFDSSSLKDDDLALMLFNKASGANVKSIDEINLDNVGFDKNKPLFAFFGGFSRDRSPSLSEFLNQKGIYPQHILFIGESKVYPNFYEILDKQSDIIEKSVKNNFDKIFSFGFTSSVFEQVKQELNNSKSDTFVFETSTGETFKFPKRFAKGFYKLTAKLEELSEENRQNVIDAKVKQIIREKRESNETGIKPVIVKEFYNDGSTDILKYAIELIDNPIIKNAVKNAKNIKVVVFSNEEFSKDGVAAWYQPNTNSIYIHEENLRIDRGAFQLLAHELIHGVTHISINYDNEFKNEINRLLEEVKNKTGKKYQKNNEDSIYGLKDEHEFLSEAFSNPLFKQLLESIKDEKETNLSLWQKFVNLIFNLFKKESKYKTEIYKISTLDKLNSIVHINNFKFYNKSDDSYSGKLESLSNFISQKSQENNSFQQFQQSLNKPNTNPILQGNQEAVITTNDKIVFGHPGIGKTFLRESGRTDVIDFDSDYKSRINEELGLEKGFKARNAFQKSNKEEYQKAVRKLWIEAKKEAKNKGKQLFASDMILLREFANDFDKVITMSKETFVSRAKQRNDYTPGAEGTEGWKQSLDTAISNVDKSKVVSTDKYLSDLFTNTQQEQVKKFAELQERLNNKEFLEGAKFAFESSEELQQFGTQEQYNDYIARVSLGIIKNPSSGGYNYTSKVKDIVYHTNTRGRIESFNSEKGLFVTPTWELAKTYKPGVNGKRFQLIINSKNIDEVSEETIMNGKKQSGDTLMYSEPDYTEYVVFEPEQIHILGSNKDIEGFKEFVQGKQFDEGEVSYVLKSLSILQSTKAQELFEKGYKNNWSLDKILTELQIPKEQKQIILDSGKNSREEIITDLLANYSYTVEINTARESGKESFDSFMIGNDRYTSTYGENISYWKNNTKITKEEFMSVKKPTQYYSNLTVNEDFYKNNPDWEYRIQQIVTPNITPSIQNHNFGSQEDANKIGWFRAWYNKKTGEVHVLEVQSDLFQKGRDNNNLEANTKPAFSDGGWQDKRISKEEYDSINIKEQFKSGENIVADAYEKNTKDGWIYQKRMYRNGDVEYAKIFISDPRTKGNQFLQLLNKNNNWITFFVKSIIQDSAKKGYEKVLFPTGNTASKVEGHSTLEEFKKQKEDRIKELEKAQEELPKEIADYSPEINQLKQELERVEKEGFGALKPIYNFYENTVTNILKKQGYNPVLITDEYGNTWNEVSIETGYIDSIYLQTENKDLTPSKASPETIKRVKEWLSRIGVDIKALDTTRYKGINGVADILNNIIEIAEGKTNEALTEEAMHFAVEIMEITNPSLYKKMLNKIGNYQIYKNLSIDKTYIKQFTKQGKLDIIGMKKEAIGKVLAETLIRSDQEVIEKPEFLEQSKSWWEEILNWFKSLIGKAGYNPFEEAIEGLSTIGTVESLKNRQELVKLGKRLEKVQSSETSVFQDEINKALDKQDYRAAISLIANQLTPETFDTVVRTSLNGDTKLGQDIQDFARVYLQVAPVENPSADTIINSLSEVRNNYNLVKHEDTVDPDDENSNSYYTATIEGETRKTDRTTEWAKRENLKRTGGRDYMKNRPADLKRQDAVKAMTGTRLHSFIENTIKVCLNDDKTVKNIDDIDLDALPKPSGAVENALQTYLLGDTRKGINGFIFQFPAGTKVLTEEIIFNPNIKDKSGKLVGRAGTLDLMVLLPTGKVKVYDWKFMGFSEGKLDQAPQKRSQHALQLGDYKRTLKESYGIKDVELQTVPFAAIYKMKDVDGKRTPVLKSIITGNINTREEENTFLLPITPNDQSSGNLKVDALVKALQAHYKKLYEKRVDDKERYLKIQGLNQLSIAIRNLQVALNFKPIEAEAATFRQNIDKTIEKYNNIDLTTLSKEDKSKQINELLDLIKSADTYANLDEAFISEYGEEDLDKDKQSTLKNLRAISSAAKDSKVEITNLLKKYVANVAVEEGFSVNQVLSATKQVQGIINSFLEGTKLPSAMMNLAAKIIIEARSQDKITTSKEIEKFGELYTALQKENPSDPFKAIGDGNELIRETKAEFWNDLNTAYEKEDVDFIMDNVDQKKLKESIDELIEQRFEQIENTIYNTDEEENDKEKEKHRKQVIKDFNIFAGRGFEGFNNHTFRKLVKEAVIKEKHYTDEFKKLSGAALAMYQYLFELNRKAFKLGYLGNGHTMRFFPFVLGTTIERLEQSKNILSAATSTLKDAFTVQKDEEVSYGKIDPETGKLVKSIPKFFTTKGNKEGKENEFSTDLLKVVPLYIRALTEYETSKNLEMTLLAMHTVEKAKGHFEERNGQVIFEEDSPKIFETNEINAQVLEVMTEDAIYGIKQEGDTLLDTAVSKIKKGTEAEKQQTKLSTKKSIQVLNSYTQGLAVGLKTLVAVPNFVGAFMQSVINAGLYYTVSDYTNNFRKVVQSTMTGKEGNIMKGLIDLVVPLNEDVVKEGQKKIAARQSPLKWLSVWSFQDVLMSTNRIGDIAHQLTNAYSWLSNSMVVDGKIVNIRQYIQQKYKGRYKDGSNVSEVEKDMEKEIKELKETKALPKISAFNKEGILEIPGVSDEEIARYRTKVVEYGRYITGQMSSDNKAQYRRNILAQSFMMFKNWIPKQVSLRAMDIKKDPVLGQWEYGRTRLFAKTIVHLGFANILKIKELLKASPEGLSIMKEMLDQKKEDYFKKTGQELEITEEEFYDMVRKEIRAEFKELAMLMSMISLVIAAKLAQPPEEEDALAKNRYNFIAKLINKASDEMWFYYNPTSAESITRGSIVPSLSLLSKVAKIFVSFEEETRGRLIKDQELIDESHPLKYFLNVVPVASQFQNEILPIVFPEEAKEMGIRTSAAARAMR